MAAVESTCTTMSPDQAGAEEPLVQSVVERIEDGLATLIVGPNEEEWVFPAHLLPAEATEGSVLILQGKGRNFGIIGIGLRPVTVEDRLARSLNRRRRIVVPLPHREIPVPVPDVHPTGRPSRMIRGLSQR